MIYLLSGGSIHDEAVYRADLESSEFRPSEQVCNHFGMLGQEEAASLTDIPNIRQKGTRLGNWPTREQAKELLAVPDRSTLQGKRDYVILALLVGCALRRNELAELDVATIQQREGRWVLADLERKGRRVRTLAIPIVVIPIPVENGLVGASLVFYGVASEFGR